MQKLDLNNILSKRDQDIFGKYPSFIRKVIIFLLRKILYLDPINEFLESHHDKRGIEFIDEVFDWLDIGYLVSSQDRLKIPSEGRVICVANHSLGGLDGLILLKLISEVRRDVKILVNDWLVEVDNLQDLFLPIDIFSKKYQRDSFEGINKAMKQEVALIIFPAGEVARLGLTGIKEAKWQKGVLHFAKKYSAPVLPVHINARNSLIFYFVSLLNKNLSTVLLVHELFNKKGKAFTIRIGDHISHKAFDNKYQKANYQTKLLRKHLLSIGKGKSGIFSTEKNVIHPISIKIIKQQIEKCKPIGLTYDNKKIFLIDSQSSPDVIKEIARLREVTFRKVGEGTGKKLDYDRYDKYYKHLVLWDDKELEIIGAYRLGLGEAILQTLGIGGFYTSEQFNHSLEFQEIIYQSVELGRSFIQSKYWNTYALDYLWQGLGAYLKVNPEIKYFLGGVSMSNTYSEEAKKHIVYFFRKWFGNHSGLSAAKHKFIISNNEEQELKKIYNSYDYKTELFVLKNILKHLGFSIPVLYKQYSELCEADGIKFIDFCVDPNFNNCVDALILVDVAKIKKEKRERYIDQTMAKRIIAPMVH